MANQNLYKVFFHKMISICYHAINETKRILHNKKNILNHTILLTDNCYYCKFYKVYILYV